MPPANRADAAALKKEGNAAFSKGAYQAAIESYTAAIDLWMEDADRATLYSNRAAARMKLDAPDRALPDAERACVLAPGYAKAHFRKAQSLVALRRNPEALAALDTVLQLAPGDSAALELRATLQK